MKTSLSNSATKPAGKFGKKAALHAYVLQLALFGFGAFTLSSTSLAQNLTDNDTRSLDLIAAVKAGDSQTAQLLLDGVKDVNVSEADGSTALHYAVLNNDAELVSDLLRKDADVNARSRYGVTAIYLAAQNGSADVLETLLKAGANPNEEYREGERVLMTAARTGDYATVETLLDAGAEVDARETWHGQTALMWATAQQHPQLIPLFVKHGADVNAISNVEVWERQITEEPRDKWLPPGGMSPLQFAAREGCVACIEPLLEARANIDAATQKGITSLLLAIINGHYDVAWTLIEAGANVNINDDTNRSPLYAAVDFNIMPESNRPAPDVFGNTHTAFELIDLLITKGADVNVQLNQQAPYRLKLDRGTDSMLVAGTTPFLRAAKSADIAAMKILLERGADPTLSTVQGINPLMTAANLSTKESDTTGRYKTEAQMIDAIRICLEQGLDVNAKAKDGRTAVFGAATFGLNDVITFLHEQGAILDYTDTKGLSPLDAASGKAGGFGFVGNDGVFWEDTVTLIQELIKPA
ncbi:MAG: ankyrin repeat domain-containing protein [Pseudomonadota bacterium]